MTGPFPSSEQSDMGFAPVDMNPRNIVVDASAVVALVLTRGAVGRKVHALTDGAYVMAPTMLPFEVTNVIRRQESARLLTHPDAELAWAGLAALDPELWQWSTLAESVWQLRGSITAYDASYVALAQIMNCPLVTCDARLAAMAPATCQVELVQ